MSEEEKEAIEFLKWQLRLKCEKGFYKMMAETQTEIVLNLIDKQQKEIEELKEDISNMYDEKVVRNILEDECGLSKYEIEEILN